MHEHRFAFFYWALSHDERVSRKALGGRDRPVLLTVDYHDDIGGDCDFIPEELLSLDLADRTGLALFCWCRLRRQNDGQVAPALFLNMFSDVYVLLKQGRTGRRLHPNQKSRAHTDHDGTAHTIRYFHRTADLLRALAADTRDIYLDIDLDYFTHRDDKGRSRALGASRLVSRRTIERFFSFEGRFVPSVLHHLVGFTIALEPQHCGGIAQSLRVLDILNQEVFGGTLRTDGCKWRKHPVLR